jgi:hypothetical protein
MSTNRFDKLKQILNSTGSVEHKTTAFRLILSYYAHSLTTDELFSLIPYIWKINHPGGYPPNRRMLEDEIRRRQDPETLKRLINLIESDNKNYRFVALDMLIAYPNPAIIKPLLKYIDCTKDDLMTKRSAIWALINIEDKRVTNMLLKEYEIYRNKESDNEIFNYLYALESGLARRGIETKK